MHASMGRSKSKVYTTVLQLSTEGCDGSFTLAQKIHFCCSWRWMAQGGRDASCWGAVGTCCAWLGDAHHVASPTLSTLCSSPAGNSSRQACPPSCLLKVLTQVCRQLQHLPGHLLAAHAQCLKPLGQHCILVVVAVVCNRQKISVRGTVSPGCPHLCFRVDVQLSLCLPSDQPIRISADAEQPCRLRVSRQHLATPLAPWCGSLMDTPWRLQTASNALL